jgi:hypothetical protein
MKQQRDRERERERERERDGWMGRDKKEQERIRSEKETCESHAFKMFH